MQILAISGSLRALSTNTVLLKAAAALAPKSLELTLYEGLAELPHFSPDLDCEPLPPSVRDFRSRLLRSAGVIISTPEYAHGIPGTLKNTLDWLVASGELYEKPVALFNASPRSTYAQASLTETLSVMTARIVNEACITVPLLGKALDSDALLSDPEICITVRSALERFAHFLNK